MLFTINVIFWYETSPIEYFFISNVDIDALEQHQGISSHSAQYAPMPFQVFRG